MFKLLHSIINAAAALLVSVWALPLFAMNLAQWRIAYVAAFFVLNVACELKYGRCLGMMMRGIHYSGNPSIARRLCFVCLYVISFSTVLYYIWFPGDLLLANMLLFQLPCFLAKRNTFHGYIAGVRSA